MYMYYLLGYRLFGGGDEILDSDNSSVTTDTINESNTSKKRKKINLSWLELAAKRQQQKENGKVDLGELEEQMKQQVI